MVNRDLIFEKNKYIYNFQQFETIRSFAKTIFGGKTTLNDADNDQSKLLTEIAEFKKNKKLKDIKKKKKENRYS